MGPGEPRHRKATEWLAGATLPGLLILLAAAPRALAEDPRDIVFECPCSAEWVAGAEGQGTLQLSFGLRSHRATESGAFYLEFYGLEINQNGLERGQSTVGRLAANGVVQGLQRTSRQVPRPSGDARIGVGLYESSNGSADSSHFHEALTLWPVPGC